MSDRPWHDRFRFLTASLLLGLVTLGGCAQQPTQEGQSQAKENEQQAKQKSEGAEKKKVSREVVKPDHPVRYTVKRGDTLWDIAEKFLRDPWVWPEIWSVNPQIENPHLIYPGDVIRLAYAEGEPRLRVKRPGAAPEQEQAKAPTDEEQRAEPSDEGAEVVKLSPRVREQPVDDAVDAIPGDAIRQFLNEPRVVSQEQVEAAPYLLGNYDGRLISSTGNIIFGRGFKEETQVGDRFSIFRPGEPLLDPKTGEQLGYETLKVGQAIVRRAEQPVKLEVTGASREILRGDRLMPSMPEPAQTQYIPKVPEDDVQGQVIKLFDAVARVGQNQVVVLNLGEREKMQIGHVLEISQSGGTTQDPYAVEGETETVELPRERVGTLMIFKIFDKVSYGLILSSTQSIALNDRVSPPD